MSNLELWEKVERTNPKHTKAITGKESLLDRAMSHIEPQADGCWLWTGSTQKNGYGTIHVCRENGKVIVGRAHRVVYELLAGPIPEGLDLDHLCRVRKCVNPKHLEPVTRSVNLKRGVGGEVARASKALITHCPSGHPYSGENLYVTNDGKRTCRTCRSAASRAYKQRKRA
jgi:hypothetical protein